MQVWFYFVVKITIVTVKKSIKMGDKRLLVVGWSVQICPYQEFFMVQDFFVSFTGFQEDFKSSEKYFVMEGVFETLIWKKVKIFTLFSFYIFKSMQVVSLCLYALQKYNLKANNRYTVFLSFRNYLRSYWGKTVYTEVLKPVVHK